MGEAIFVYQGLSSSNPKFGVGFEREIIANKDGTVSASFHWEGSMPLYFILLGGRDFIEGLAAHVLTPGNLKYD